MGLGSSAPHASEIFENAALEAKRAEQIKKERKLKREKSEELLLKASSKGRQVINKYIMQLKIMIRRKTIIMVMVHGKLKMIIRSKIIVMVIVHERGGEGVGVGKVEEEHVDSISLWDLQGNHMQRKIGTRRS